jgi:hypothetical protein
MLYRLIADGLLLIHFCYILFVIFGGLLILRWRDIWKIHLPAVLWGFLVQFFVWICPLTSWENHFRELGGESGYQNGFIDYFLTSIIYIDINPYFHMIMAVLLLSLNLSIYYKIFINGNRQKRNCKGACQ